jgi:2-methylisocitrate lyase-like PEP mutase family enzyme
VTRANAYLAAGADLVFVAYVETLDEARVLKQEIQGPVSIAAGLPYNMHQFSVKQLMELAVARVSLPTINIVSSIRAMRSAMQEIRSDQMDE